MTTAAPRASKKEQIDVRIHRVARPNGDVQSEFNIVRPELTLAEDLACIHRELRDERVIFKQAEERPAAMLASRRKLAVVLRHPERIEKGLEPVVDVSGLADRRMYT